MKHIVMFKPIPGFERYEISECGSIRRADTKKPLKPWLDGQYRRVELRMNGKSRTLRVHRLILDAFEGPRPDMEACHRNGVHTDNRLSNLYWGTHSENMLDKVSHGTHHNSIKTHCHRGHEFTTENTKNVVQGTWRIRQCRSCTNENARLRRAIKEGR